MATSRGITETKIYDRQAVIDRYGIAPELIPDFYGLKGDTSDNIPGVPGIGDKTASELIQSFGTLEEVLAHVDEISGAKRKENLIEHAEDARISKQLATVQRDVAVDFDVAAESRARARPLARARGLPRVRAARPAAAPGGSARRPRRRRAARRRRGHAERRACAPATPADIARLGAADGERARARRARDRDARGRAVRRRPAVALRGRAPDGAEVLARRLRRPRAGRRGRSASAPSSRTTRRRFGSSRRASRTTRCSAPTCSSPARRGYPFAELCEERGLASDLEDPLAADAVLLRRARRLAARADRRARPRAA